MSWVSVFALRTMIGAWLFGRTSRMNEKPSMPPSMRSTSMRSGRVALDEQQGGLGAGRLGDVVPLVLHGEAEGGTDAVVVLEDQELQRHGGNPASGT